MLGKIQILITIFALLLAFYLVIWLGSGKRKKTTSEPKISRYMLNVKILIIFIAIVSLILWSFI